MSSLRPDCRLTRLITATITSAATKAPMLGSTPIRTATAMPGRTPWASASPTKVMPRITTQVPMVEVMATASSPATSARCMNANPNGSVSQSIVRSEPRGPGPQARASTIRSALVRISSR